MCHNGPTQKTADCPTVNSVEIVPAALTITLPEATAPPTGVTLRVVLRTERDDREYVIGDTKCWPATYETDPSWLGHSVMDSRTVLLEVPSDLPAVPEAKVWATAGSKTSDPAIVTVKQAATDDQVIALHEQATLPTAAILDAKESQAAGDCLNDGVFAFVRRTSVGELDGPCDWRSPLAVFSSAHSAVLLEGVWTSDPNVADASVKQTPLIEVPVAIWVAVDERANPENPPSPASVATDAAIDLTLAQARFAENRTGVTFVQVDNLQNDLPVTDPDAIDAIGSSCTDADKLTSTGTNPNIVPGVLNIYYLNHLTHEAGADVRAVHCRGNPRRDEDVILVSSQHRSAASLAHELGHSMGLLFPDNGHTESLYGFDDVNLMTQYVELERAAVRAHLSLGQAFRINADAASWLNRATTYGTTPQPLRDAPTLKCPCDPYDGLACPRLAADIGQVEEPLEPVLPSECRDGVYLENTDESHQAVGLMSGRLWRDPVGECTSDSVGFRDPGPASLRLLFPNFDEPAGCFSRLVIFFAHHEAILRDLPIGGKPTLAIDEIQLPTQPKDALSVPVVQWHGGTQAPAIAEAHRESADAVFAGEGDAASSYTGLKFHWTATRYASDLDRDAFVQEFFSKISDSDCDDLVESYGAAVAADSVNVYYGNTALGFPGLLGHGFWCNDAGTYFIALAPDETIETALTHNLGHVLGLEDLDLGNSLFTASNVMWKPSDVTGDPDDRLHFTLGQVFRLNFEIDSWLGRSPVSPRDASEMQSCAEGQDHTCPNLEVDLPANDGGAP
jgi:hypothetical protein